jgi:hypothetical protein
LKLLTGHLESCRAGRFKQDQVAASYLYVKLAPAARACDMALDRLCNGLHALAPNQKRDKDIVEQRFIE